MRLIKNGKLSSSVTSSLFIVLCLASASFAQDNQSEQPAMPTEKETEDLMKQSQMTVPELIKNGIIPDGDNGSGASNDSSSQAKPEDMEKQIEEARGGRSIGQQSQNAPQSQFAARSQNTAQLQGFPQSQFAPRSPSAAVGTNNSSAQSQLAPRTQGAAPQQVAPQQQSSPEAQKVPQTQDAQADNSKPAQNIRPAERPSKTAGDESGF